MNCEKEKRLIIFIYLLLGAFHFRTQFVKIYRIGYFKGIGGMPYHLVGSKEVNIKEVLKIV